MEQQAIAKPEQATLGEAQAPAAPAPDKPKKGRGKAVLRIVLTVLIIAAGIFLVLFILRVAAKYDSIPDMLRDMWNAVTDAFKYGLRN